MLTKSHRMSQWYKYTKLFEHEAKRKTAIVITLVLILGIGGSPYQNMEVLELIDRLESGYRMEKPGLVPDDV